MKLKKLAIIGLSSLLLGASLFASEGEEGTHEKESEFKKMGFLTTEWCVQEGYFVGCPLDTYQTSKTVLYVHDDGKYYYVDYGTVPEYEIDEIINRNEVTLMGKYDEPSNTIIMEHFEAPPPPGKSFFKGCL